MLDFKADLKQPADADIKRPGYEPVQVATNVRSMGQGREVGLVEQTGEKIRPQKLQ
jgi:hypothetical protein|tara:strand:- start:43 stop:210 length:168 start_codon:yes stop_codon:yes gene_type:complete